MVNVQKLHQELDTAGIIYDGISVSEMEFKKENFPKICGFYEKDDSFIRVDYTSETTEEMKTNFKVILDNHNPVWYIEERIKEYPSIGEQLDNLTKCLYYLRDSGIELGEFGDSFVDTNLAVKIKHPKE